MSRLEQAPPSFAAALYSAAGFMVIAPFLYESQRILPLQLSDLDWRFGAEGFLLTALTTPLLGIALGRFGALCWLANPHKRRQGKNARRKQVRQGTSIKGFSRTS